MESHQGSSRSVITKEVWEKKLDDVKIRKEDMNKLVMDFLVTLALRDVAEQFGLESGMENMDLESVTHRIEIRRAIESGDVEGTIQRINELNPEILDGKPTLNFNLQLQRLIELIRNEDVDKALDFAGNILAPLATENENYMEELERAMMLLAYNDVNECPFRNLLDISRRPAIEIDKAILASQGHEKDPKIMTVLRNMRWVESQLQRAATYPYIEDLFTAALSDR